jgi:predicted MFS family arabinose efflux permease
MVAVVQLAITLGAALGGMLFDRWGYQATFLVSSVLLTSSALIAVRASRKSRPVVERAAHLTASTATP